MAEPTVSEIMDSIVSRVRTAMPDLANRITYGPPEGKPEAPSIWLTYGPVEIDWGLIEVTTPQVRANCAVPRKANYPREYRTANDLAQQVHWAMRGEWLIAGEATITGIGISEPVGVGWAGVPDQLVVAVVTLTIETKEHNTYTGVDP